MPNAILVDVTWKFLLRLEVGISRWPHRLPGCQRKKISSNLNRNKTLQNLSCQPSNFPSKLFLALSSKFKQFWQSQLVQTMGRLLLFNSKLNCELKVGVNSFKHSEPAFLITIYKHEFPRKC